MNKFPSQSRQKICRFADKTLLVGWPAGDGDVLLGVVEVYLVHVHVETVVKGLDFERSLGFSVHLDSAQCSNV